MKLNELLETLSEEDEEMQAEAKKPAKIDLEAFIVQQGKNLDAMQATVEAMIDLGCLLGFWTSDVLRLSIRNVVEFNKQKGPSELMIKRRQEALKALLKEYARSSSQEVAKGKRKAH